MTTNANWTIVFEDKLIMKKTGSDQGSYEIADDAFWSQSKFSNIWAIQYGSSNTSDEVEYRDETPHSSYDDANLGDITQFINKWDEAHLAKLQANWDEDDRDQSEKGLRPTSYSSL